MHHPFFMPLYNFLLNWNICLFSYSFENFRNIYGKLLSGDLATLLTMKSKYHNLNQKLDTHRSRKEDSFNFQVALFKLNFLLKIFYQYFDNVKNVLSTPLFGNLFQETFRKLIVSCRFSFVLTLIFFLLSFNFLEDEKIILKLIVARNCWK